MKAKRTGIRTNWDSKKIELTLELEGISIEQLDELTNHEYLDINIKKWSGRKTLSQNSYAWALITAIAQKHRLNREEVYQKLLRDNHNFEDYLLPTLDNDKNDLRLNKLKGIFRIVDDYGTTNITTESGKRVKSQMYRCYLGMSSFDKEEMREFLDLVVFEAEQDHIPTNPDLYKGVCNI